MGSEGPSHGYWEKDRSLSIYERSTFPAASLYLVCSSDHKPTTSQAVGQPLPARLLKLEQSRPIQLHFLKLRPNRSQYMQSWHGKNHRFHAAQAAEGVARLFLPFPLSFLCLSLLCIGCGPCWSDLDIAYARLQPKYPGYKSKDWILSPAQRPSWCASSATAQSKQETENDRKTTTYSHAVKS